MTVALNPAPAPLAKGTLSRQLVIRVTALVALVAVLLSALLALAAYNIQMAQLDARLDSAATRPDRGDGDGPAGRGQEIGTLTVVLVGNLASGRILVDQSGNQVGFEPLSADIVQRLVALNLTTGQRATVDLPQLGSYRVTLKPSFTGGSTIIGLPMTQLYRGMTALSLLEALLAALTIGIAFFAARAVVVRSLAPLNRLTATASAVSALELERGEVDVPVRVPPGDTDPVSEVGRVGLAFNHMLDNVEGALAARHASETKVRQFVADASHELRNPLASIRGYAELTRRERDTMSPTMSHALGRIESESDRMSRLVEDLLLLARLDSGPALDLKPTDVTEVVLNAVSDARAAGSDHQWSIQVPDEPVTARADRYRLHQVVANLLANARTHTPAGTKVITTLRAEGPWAVITVADNGPGIPAAILPSVFERFTRADSSRVRKDGGSSTGLGLAIVAAVVAAHGGRAAVTSDSGGTEFTVRVPLV